VWLEAEMWRLHWPLHLLWLLHHSFPYGNRKAIAVVCHIDLAFLSFLLIDVMGELRATTIVALLYQISPTTFDPIFSFREFSFAACTSGRPVPTLR
jgi:hypothetical protein